MLFKLNNRSSEKRTHCGVLEFIAEEGMIYMPYWVSVVQGLYPAACHFEHIASTVNTSLGQPSQTVCFAEWC